MKPKKKNVAFLDIKAAYNCFNRGILWRRCLNRGVCPDAIYKMNQLIVYIEIVPVSVKTKTGSFLHRSMCPLRLRVHTCISKYLKILRVHNSLLCNLLVISVQEFFNFITNSIVYSGYKINN